MRRKRLFSFLNDIPNNEIPKYFDGVKHDEYRLMLRNGTFELLIDEETFVAVMEKYSRLKNERNHSNHARSDRGEFATAEELKAFIENGLNELEEALRK